MKNLLLLFCLSLISLSAFAQWDEFYEIDNNNFYFAHINPAGKLLLGAERANIYIQNENNTFDIADLQSFGFLSAIDFESEQVGYMGGGCYYVFDECLPNTIYKTEDGGKTWAFKTQHGSTGVFNSIQVVGEQEIFALSDYEYLLFSSDGGDTWTTSEINPNDEIGRHEKLRFLNSNTGFVVGRGHQPNIGSYGILYKTTDGADTWEMIYETSQSTSDFHDYFFIDEMKGFAAHSFGEIATTTDGGDTWTISNYTNNTDEQATKIVFVTNNIGYLVSRNTVTNQNYIYRTEDGGQTWTVDFEAENEGITDLVFEDSENGYAIINYRKVYKRSGIVAPTTLPLEIEIAPNPVQNELLISSLNLPIGSYQLMVFNSIGQNVVSTNEINSPVNVQKLMNGVYFIEIRNQQSELVAKGKFIKAE